MCDNLLLNDRIQYGKSQFSRNLWNLGVAPGYIADCHRRCLCPSVCMECELLSEKRALQRVCFILSVEELRNFGTERQKNFLDITQESMTVRNQFFFLFDQNFIVRGQIPGGCSYYI